MSYSHEPTIAVIELASIARGVLTVDRVLKEATVTVLAARPVTPGRYVILFTGSVDDVRSSLAAGLEIGAGSIVDHLHLPAVDETVLAALARPVSAETLDAVGVMETTTISASVEAADAAVKRGRVALIEMHLASGIDGKSYFTFTGEVSDVWAAMAAAAEVAARRDRLVHHVVIPRPHLGMRAVLDGHQRPL